MNNLDRRKELKLAYKQNPPPIGVFRIKNAITGKMLVGSSLNLPGKRNRSLFQLKLGSHVNQALQTDWNAYGPDAFSFEILETIKTADLPPADWRDAVRALEQKWLDALQPFGERGYNQFKEKAPQG